MHNEMKALAHKTSMETARFVNDYYERKVKRMAPKIAGKASSPEQQAIAAGYVYMAMLGGTIGVVTSVIEAIAKNNPDLAQRLREDMTAKIQQAGTNG
jgi:hypothetical protein